MGAFNYACGVIRVQVSIACKAVDGLEERGVTFSEAQKADLVKSMLIMSMSDAGPKPVVPV